jgi:hypothetical protein
LVALPAPNRTVWPPAVEAPQFASAADALGDGGGAAADCDFDCVARGVPAAHPERPAHPERNVTAATASDSFRLAFIESPSRQPDAGNGRR